MIYHPNPGIVCRAGRIACVQDNHFTAFRRIAFETEQDDDNENNKARSDDQESLHRRTRCHADWKYAGVQLCLKGGPPLPRVFFMTTSTRRSHGSSVCLASLRA